MQDFASWATDVEGDRLAWQMNRRFFVERIRGYGLGSFCTHNGLLHFCTFVPNFLYTPGMLYSLYLTSANRAEEMSRVLTGQGWEGVNYDVAKSRRAESD